MTASLKKLTSAFLMLSFTVFGFVMLAVSIVLMAAESLTSSILSPAKAPKKGSLTEPMTRVKVPSRESQSCLWPWLLPNSVQFGSSYAALMHEASAADIKKGRGQKAGDWRVKVTYSYLHYDLTRVWGYFYHDYLKGSNIIIWREC